MPSQKTIDLIGYVHTSNKSKMYEKNKTKPKPAPTYAELKASHDNHFLDRQMEMIRQELKDCISEK